MSQPYIRFFGVDWRSDPRLRLCSLAARGMWIDVITLLMEAEPFGHLVVNGVPATPDQIAVLTCTPVAAVRKTLAELERNGVFSRTDEGVIYSRRMVRDAAKSQKAREDDKRGGNPKLIDSGYPPSPNPPVNGGDKPIVNGQDKGAPTPPLTPALKPHGNNHSHSQGQEETENPDPRSQSPIRALRAPAADYAFAGSIIRLTKPDFERWKASFSAIPDLRAELETIDAKFVDEGFNGSKWFGRVSGWLKARHEELLRQKTEEDDLYRGVL